eukprot:m.15883 g.15883  ORF g.15883 m.15883 type:complete len:70 (+) comp7955_c0_seq1:138-347(+)
MNIHPRVRSSLQPPTAPQTQQTAIVHRSVNECMGTAGDMRRRAEREVDDGSTPCSIDQGDLSANHVNSS